MTIYPTVLYIKQHSITGLKYFGKTTQDPYKYNGSGVYWTDHIKVHGPEHIITTNVFGPFIDKDAIEEFALAFSRDNNIVESKLWANIRPENGLDGGGNKGIPHSTETRQKMSDMRKGKPHSAETKQKMSDAKKGVKQGPHSTERKQKMSDAKKGVPTGRPAWNKGISSLQKGIPTGKQQNPAPEVKCPHCGLVGKGGNMTRYHFDNCKKNPNYTGSDDLLSGT